MGRRRYTTVDLPVIECAGLVVRQSNGGPRIELGVSTDGDALIVVKDSRGNVCLQAAVNAAGTVAGFEAVTIDQSCRAKLAAGKHAEKGPYAVASVTSRRGKDRVTLEASNRFGADCDAHSPFELCEPDV